MSDRAFEWAMTSLTALMVVWIIAGATLRLANIFAVVFSAIVVEAVAGILIARAWGNDYMSRRS